MTMREKIEALISAYATCVDDDILVRQAQLLALDEADRLDAAELAALKAELAAAKVAEGEAMLVVESQDVSIEKLKVKLKEYAEPLTDEQARAVMMVENRHGTNCIEEIVKDRDEGIREVRRGLAP